MLIGQVQFVIANLLNNNNKEKKKILKEKMKMSLSISYTRINKIFNFLDEKNIIKNQKNTDITLNQEEGAAYGIFYYDANRNIGIVTNLDRSKQMYIIPKEHFCNALNGDLVKIENIKPNLDKKRLTATVKTIIIRYPSLIEGTIIHNEMSNKSHSIFISEHNKVPYIFKVNLEKSKKTKSYDKVEAQIDILEDKDKPMVFITNVYGFKVHEEDDIAEIIEYYGLQKNFPTKVIQQANKLDTAITSEFIINSNRKDLRNETIFTIDGADAKDLDDAVSIKKTKEGTYLLSVHIADVAHYVKEHSKLDKEAYLRGTSVYLLNTVLPMLPEKLSNDLCSLHPNTDKLTLSVTMHIDKKGTILSSRFYESVISSKAKLVYDDVSAYLDNTFNEYELTIPTEITESLKIMKELMLILERKRINRGTVDFNFPEAQFEYDNEGTVVNLKPEKRGTGNKLIEEFMIVTNEATACLFEEHALPFMYRVHEKPQASRLEDLRLFLEKLNYFLPEEANSKDYQLLLASIADKKEEKAVQLLLLQSMKQARYTNENVGHFGLASDAYTHFTSPIRRYPDLIVHRIVKDFIHNIHSEIDTSSSALLNSELSEKGKSCSSKERIAEKAEQELKLLKKIDYILAKPSDTEYVAMITSISTKGLSILLDNTIEGFIPISSLSKDSSAIYIEDKHIIITKNNTFTLGDKLIVHLIKADRESKEIIFNLL